MINKQGLELIELFEGFSPNPYLCQRGVPTIGIGSTTYKDGSPVTLKDSAINKILAYDLLNFHVEIISNKIGKFLDSIHLKLNENQFSALVCFSYNLGIGPIIKEGRSVNEALKKRDHKLIAGSLLLYVKYTDNNGNKQISNGLQRRRKAERDLYLS
jgi:lysozyme